MEYGTPNVWQSEVVVVKGGVSLNTDALTSGTTEQGSARILQNFECALEGGYRRINGYTKWDSAVVPGTTSNPILGIKAALGGVFAARKTTATPTTDIYYSTGAGWGSRINTANRGGSPVKVRFITYTISTPSIAGCDGVNYAFKYDGTTYTLLNTVGAPVNPKYVEMFNASLAFAGYSANTQNVTITAPNTDDNFSAAAGAVEINVGDTIVGLKNFRNALYVFCTNRIFKIIVDSTTVYSVQQVTGQIGCLSGDTVQEVGGDLIYLAPDGFRSVAGTYNIGDVDLSLQSRAIQPIIRDLLKIPTITNWASCPIRKKSQYRCWFYDTTISKANAIGVIGKLEQGSPLQAFNGSYTTYAWSTTSGIQPYCADSYFDSSTERAVIGDPVNGFVYLLESGNDFDGTSIQAVYQSPYLTFKDASLRKVMQKLTVYTQAEGLASINLDVNYDFAYTGVLHPVTQVLDVTGLFPVYGGSVYDTDVYSSLYFPVFRQNIIGSGFTASFTYSSSGGAPYRIDSYQIIYGLKGRR